MPDRIAALLVSPATVELTARGQVAGFGGASGPRDDEFIARCVEHATGVLKTILGYPPRAHVRTTDAERHGYAYAGLIRRIYQYGVGPVSVALTPGYTVDARGRLAVEVLPDDREVSYVAGWRPEGMTDADVLDLIGTPDGPDGEPLTAGDMAAVPTFPDDLAAALCDAAVAIGGRLSAGLAGQRETTVDLGSGSRTTTSAAAFNDVNTLIGRTPEVHAILASAAMPYRNVHV